MARRRIVLLAAALLLAHVVSLATLGARPLGQLLSNLIQLSLVVLAALACRLTAAGLQGHLRRAWRLVALSCGLWACGQLVFLYYGFFMKQPPPLTSIADAFFVAFYVPLTFALLLDPQAEEGKLDGLQALDLAQMAILLGSVYAYFFLFLGTRVQERRELVDFGLLRVWDLLNLLLLGLFLYRMASTPVPDGRRFLARMAGVLVIYTLGDGLDTYAYLRWGLAGGDWTDLGYSLPFAAAVVAAATWPPSPEPESLRPAHDSKVALWAQFVPVLAPIAAILMAAHMVTRFPSLAFTILGVSMACFSVRLALTQHRQQATLARLRSSEARYRDLIENANDVILTLDVDGKLATLNHLGEALTGYGGPGPKPALADLVAPEDVPRAREMLRRTLAGETVAPFEVALVSREGRRIAVEVSCRALREEGQITGVQAIARDLTERRGMEAALRTSEERFVKAFRFSPVAMTISTFGEGRYVDVNDSFLRLMGYARPEVIGLTVHELGVWARPEKRPELLAALEERGRVTNWEIQLRSRSGEIREGMLSAEVIELDGTLHLLAGILDLTDHRRLEEQHRQGQKMEAVGRLAGGIAHDFNNLLGVILGYAEFLIEHLRADPLLARMARDVADAAQRAAALTRQLLAFSRKQVLETRVLDLNRAVDHTAELLRRLIGEHIDLQIRQDPALGRVRADPHQLEQVLLNLAINARDAMPEGGRLTLETANVELDHQYGELHEGVGPGSYVMLAVTDTGLGMDASTQARIFEPFFTTKEAGRGTGLGLATVYGIVKQSGGWIWVYSEPGRGSTFKVYLPRVWDEVEPLSPSPSGSLAARGSESVLVVEDQEQLLRLMRECLEEHGYSVLAARDGKEADLLSEDPATRIDVLVSDVVLPGGFGFEVARRLRRGRPKVRIVYISGYIDSAITERGQLAEADALVHKPFHTTELLQAVRKALDVRSSA
jgi:PAS domain S-box-containing protein